MDISFFYSFRKLDAGVDNYEVSSFKTDGLHRLERDWNKKHTVPMQTYGGNVRYTTSNLAIGITALSYSFGKYDIQPDPKPYNLFYFRGNSNMNISVDYMLKTNKLKFYGETALSSNKAVATLNAFQLTPVSYLSLLLLHRYYDRRYQAFSEVLSVRILLYRMSKVFIQGCNGHRSPILNYRCMPTYFVSPG